MCVFRFANMHVETRTLRETWPQKVRGVVVLVCMSVIFNVLCPSLRLVGAGGGKKKEREKKRKKERKRERTKERKLVTDPKSPWRPRPAAENCTRSFLFRAPSLTTPTRVAAGNLRSASEYLSSGSRSRMAALLGLATACTIRYPEALLLFATYTPSVLLKPLRRLATTSLSR